MLQFNFDANAGETPASVAQKRALVAQILGTAKSPSNVGEGFSAIGDGIVANVLGGRAAEAEKAGQASADDTFAQLVASITGQGAATPSYTPQAATASPSSLPSVSPFEYTAAGLPRDPDTGYLMAEDDPRYAEAVRLYGNNGGSADASYIRQGLINRGLPEHVADAFLLNMQDESGLNPGINEASPTVPGSRGGFGLYQLTGPRRVAYEQYAQQLGVDPSNVDAQLDFMMSELQGPEARAYQSIMAAPDTGSAAAAIVNDFLRPAEEHRARRAAQYTGGAPTQVAQGPDLAMLMEASANPWLSDSQKSVINSMIAQQMQQQDPAYQQALRAGDLGIQRAEFELEALRNKPPPLPGAPKTEKIFDPETGREKIVQWNENTGAWEDLGGVSAPKDPLVQVNTGDGAPGLGKLSPDYGYVLDPVTREPVIDQATGLPTAAAVPGSPAALAEAQAAAAAAAQEGAQLTSDVEKADTVLTTTRSVLDILDNADQPTTGTLSRPFAMYSGSPAGKIRSYVSTLQSGVALGAMKSLKEASSTGATGFGALNEKELELLISDVGALNPDTTEPEIFRETVQRIEDRSRRVIEDIKRNVSPERIQELGLQPLIDSLDGAANQSQAPAVGIDALLEKYQ